MCGGMLAWLCVWVKVQICIWPSWCCCHSPSLAPVNPDWYYLPGFTFLVPAQLGSPRQLKRAIKRLCVCVCVFGGGLMHMNVHSLVPTVWKVWSDRSKDSHYSGSNLPVSNVNMLKSDLEGWWERNDGWLKLVSHGRIRPLSPKRELEKLSPHYRHHDDHHHHCYTVHST